MKLSSNSPYDYGHNYIRNYGLIYDDGYRPKDPEHNLGHLDQKNIGNILSGKGVSNTNITPLKRNEKNLQYFATRSKDLMYKIPHKTKVLDVAQNYMGYITEVTVSQFRKLDSNQQSATHNTFIKHHGTVDEQWCAHTVSAICETAGVDIGPHKKAVAEFIGWGRNNGRYKQITTHKINENNYLEERKNREQQIKAQTKQMREGDLIIWKSDNAIKTQFGIKCGKASHIGFIESVNPDGSVSVIEGNANEYKSGKNVERYIVTNTAEGKNGNQNIGEYQEVNPRDGVIRKVYTPADLARDGYSGYISMQGLVK